MRNLPSLFDLMMMPTERMRGVEFFPECDIEDRENTYVMRMDVPGMRADDLKIEMRENQIVISGERREEHEEKARTEYHRERRYGRFHRVFALPNIGDVHRVEALFQDGVLTVTVPKTTATRSVDIKVREGRSRAA